MLLWQQAWSSIDFMLVYKAALNLYNKSVERM